MTRAWLLLSFGDDRQYAGNPGYLDEPRRVYQYDSFVPNHKQVAEGDYVLIRDHNRLQGVARIQNINAVPGEKRRFRCPECRITALKERKDLRPRYRCNNSHEFDDPIEELAPCISYSADFGTSFIDTPNGLSLDVLRSACPRHSGQLAIQEIYWEPLFPRLARKFPAVQVLFGPEAAEVEAEDEFIPPSADIKKAAQRLTSLRQGQGNFYRFIAGKSYKRREILDIVGVPPSERGGDWNTGYHLHMGDFFLFVNIGRPGRTGHDYPNELEGNRLIWYGRTGAKRSHPSIQALLAHDQNVYIFYRTKGESAFKFGGLGRPVKVDEMVPVRIVWTLEDSRRIPPETLPQEVGSSADFYEGAATTILVNVYERSAAAREACIRFWGSVCQVCEFDFERVYGSDLGSGFIHIHHLKPLSEVGATYKLDPVRDLRPVCPNCHAMLHRNRPPLDLEELKSRIRLRLQPVK